jgi:hypothetical protein
MPTHFVYLRTYNSISGKQEVDLINYLNLASRNI